MEKVHLMMLTGKDGDIQKLRSFKTRFACLRETATALKEFYTSPVELERLFSCAEDATAEDNEEMWRYFIDLYRKEEYADALQIWCAWHGEFVHEPIPLNFELFDLDLE